MIAESVLLPVALLILVYGVANLRIGNTLGSLIAQD
jgi:hypothetical protein